MKFADEMALMFLMKSILLTDWIRVKKNVHFLNAAKAFKSLTKHVLVLLFLLVCHVLYWP